MKEKKNLSKIFFKRSRTKDDFQLISLINEYKIIKECYQKAQSLY